MELLLSSSSSSFSINSHNTHSIELCVCYESKKKIYIYIIISAIGTGPSPMWQSNTNYDFSKYYMPKDAHKTIKLYCHVSLYNNIIIVIQINMSVHITL